MSTPTKSATQVIADNLAAFMEELGLNQPELARRSGVGQTTISLYLNPDKRKPGSKGKVPSPKVEELAALAKALNKQLWELTRQMSPNERRMYEKIEAAFRELTSEKNGH